MNLYYVRADDAVGVNRDLLVEAKTKLQAAVLWADHFEIEDGDKEPYYVGLVPLTGTVGAIDWGFITPADAVIP